MDSVFNGSECLSGWVESCGARENEGGSAASLFAAFRSPWRALWQRIAPRYSLVYLVDCFREESI